MRVEPSARIGLNGSSIFVSVNDHSTKRSASPAVADALMEIPGEEFGPSLERSEGIVDQFMSLANPTREWSFNVTTERYDI